MRDLITGAPGPDLEYRLDDVERRNRALETDLSELRRRCDELEERLEQLEGRSDDAG